MKKMIVAFAALAACVTQAIATPDFRITEVYTGITGEDGTPDWIEVTNFGTTNGDTSVLWYDDESLNVPSGAQLPSFDLAPGEGAVFLVTGDASAASVDEFRAIWGPVANVGFATGGGGLSQNGDTAAILLDDGVNNGIGIGSIVDLLTFPGLPSASTATVVDPDGTGASLGLATDGVGGAYTSNLFFNDNIGDGVNNIQLVGSPFGGVPEPTTVALAAIAAFGLAARRR